MRYGWFVALFLAGLGIFAGTRRAIAPTAVEDGMVQAQDYGPIPPGH